MIYKLFYATSADATAMTDPTTEATEYTFGTIGGDGSGTAAFGFNITGLTTATEYTFWLYQYDDVNSLYSESASSDRGIVG
jgi:hypothetical protein